MPTTRTVPQKVKPSLSQHLRYMPKVGLVGMFLITLGTISAPALSNGSSLQALNLTCSVHSDNYGSEQGLRASKDVTLSSSVLLEGGRHLVYKNEGLEFWALTHMTQKLGDDYFINNFEVAIQDTRSGHFFNALSDSVFSAQSTPQSARVRVANYHTGSFHEKGYMMFECHNR